jgi:hypothetical protein
MTRMGPFGPHPPDKCVNPRCGVHHKLWPTWIRGAGVAVPTLLASSAPDTPSPLAPPPLAQEAPSSRDPPGRLRIPPTRYPHGHGEMSSVYKKLGLSKHRRKASLAPHPRAKAAPSSRDPPGRLRIPPTRYPQGHGEMSSVYKKLELSKHLKHFMHLKPHAR